MAYVGTPNKLGESDYITGLGAVEDKLVSISRNGSVGCRLLTHRYRA